MIRVLGHPGLEHAHRVGVAAHVAQRATEPEQRLLAQHIGEAEFERLLVVGDRLRFAAGSVVAALAHTLGLLVAGRVLQGAGGGIFPLCFAIIRDEFPREKVSSSFGPTDDSDSDQPLRSALVESPQSSSTPSEPSSASRAMSAGTPSTGVWSNL